MKLGLVCGPYLNEWTVQSYLPLGKDGIETVGICSEDNQYSLSSIGVPVMRLRRFAQISKIPFISDGLQFLFPYKNYLLNFKQAVKDLPLLNSYEAFNVFTHQCIASGKPTVVSVFENIAFNNQRFVYKKWKKEAYENAKHIIAITNKAREAMISEGASDSRISVIPLGVDTDRFKPAPKDEALMSKYNIPMESVNILFMGSLIYRKGVLHLLEAFKELCTSRDDIYLLIAGSGQTGNEILKRAAMYGIKKQVKMLDSIPYRETHSIHNLADIFVLPSIPDKTWEEQFGFVLVEAMACGKPVVSTHSGSIPEIVENEKTGILVRPADSIELKDALERLACDADLRRQFGERGRARALEMFDSSVVSRKMAEVFRKALE